MVMPFYDNGPESFPGDVEASQDLLQAHADFEERTTLISEAAELDTKAKKIAQIGNESAAVE